MPHEDISKTHRNVVFWRILLQKSKISDAENIAEFDF